MKLDRNKCQINFWLSMTLIIVFLWYLMFTPHGAVRRELAGKHWLSAVGAKIEDINPTRMRRSKIYTTNPRLKDENGRTYYFVCQTKNLFLQCDRINY